MSPRTPEEIAAALTPTQRKALLWLPEDGSHVCAQTRRPHGMRAATIWFLEGRNLINGRPWPARQMKGLTPLGQQVRAVLAAQREDAP